EVRDIAIGRSKGYVFNTLQDLNDWMAVPDNVANLAIGDNLYIIDSQITDYWWDGTQLRELETQQPDLSNVVSSLGTATGGGNAITDLSLTGNILIPADLFHPILQMLAQTIAWKFKSRCSNFKTKYFIATNGLISGFINKIRNIN
ncbi:MAG: hypothetical protein EZS28_055945, partial [Streblomastix strix]